MQFDTDDFYAGAEFVKHFLQFGLGFVFNFAAVAGDNRLHFRLSDNFAQNRLGGDLNGDVRAAHVEEVVFGILMRQTTVRLMSTMFSSPVSMWLSVKELLPLL